MKWLEGKRTYIVLGVALILNLINGWNATCADMAEPVAWCVNITVPEWIINLLVATGFYTRAIAKTK